MNSRDSWLALIDAVREKGTTYTDQEGRQCRECMNIVATINDSHDAVELIRELQRHDSWVYPSPEELKSVIVGSGNGTHDYAYAPRLFGANNQIDAFIIPLLKKNPQSRRALAILYKPEQDSSLTSTNVPGLVSVHFRIVNEKLEVTCHLRSIDVFIGFPANLYQVACVQEYVATKLGVPSGNIHFFSSSAHYFPAEYENDYTLLSKNLRRKNHGES